jgi:diketogulonate reductase-like aldo/keto reductase
MYRAGSLEKTYQSVLNSVREIDGDDGFVDLFLIHTASGGKAARKEMWLVLEKLHESGRARSIGVSNYGVGHIEEMKEYAKIWPPHANQIEVLSQTVFGRSMLTSISFTLGASKRRLMLSARNMA